jgi:nucleoside-diphosphate-sugar epimerase
MVLVSGATGYTGFFAVSALVKSGMSVRCIVRNPEKCEKLVALGVEVVPGDLESSEDVRAALQGVEVFVNIAQIRYASSLVPVLEEAKLRRSVFFSSTWRLSRYHTPQVQSVIDGERCLESSNLNPVILRPSMIYGPGDDRNISRLRDFLSRSRIMPIFGSGSQLVQPVYVTDVADAVVACVEKEVSGQTYEIAGDQPLCYTEMIDILCRLLGRTVLKVYIPVFLALPAVKLASIFVPFLRVREDQIRRMKEDRAFNIDPARADLDYRPMGFEEGVAMAVTNSVEESD